MMKWAFFPKLELYPTHKLSYLHRSVHLWGSLMCWLCTSTKLGLRLFPHDGICFQRSIFSHISTQKQETSLCIRASVQIMPTAKPFCKSSVWSAFCCHRYQPATATPIIGAQLEALLGWRAHESKSHWSLKPYVGVHWKRVAKWSFKGNIRIYICEKWIFWLTFGIRGEASEHLLW